MAKKLVYHIDDQETEIVIDTEKSKEWLIENRSKIEDAYFSKYRRKIKISDTATIDDVSGQLKGQDKLIKI